MFKRKASVALRFSQRDGKFCCGLLRRRRLRATSSRACPSANSVFWTSALSGAGVCRSHYKDFYSTARADSIASSPRLAGAGLDKKLRR